MKVRNPYDNMDANPQLIGRARQEKQVSSYFLFLFFLYFKSVDLTLFSLIGKVLHSSSLLS